MGNQPTTEKQQDDLSMREAMLPPKLRDWRAKLSAKAKQQKRYRFYSLYALVSHPETLRAAWEKVRVNAGSPGVDGVSIKQIEQGGVEPFLKEIAESLKQKSYRCGVVRRVYIPKANGKLRPLGIPNVRDRVVQAAVLLILEPIFEADFLDCSFGFRPGRSAHDALETIREALKSGRTTVYDADMEGYFDSIPHDKLMACVRMRVVDGSVLGLIRQWLQALVLEPGTEEKPPMLKRNDSGTPQGGVISPLLANIYLHWFDEVFHRAGSVAQKLGAKLVRYADDFVVLTRQQSTELGRFIEEKIEDWLGLKINREKTRVVNLREEGAKLDFLGYSFGLEWVRYAQYRQWRMAASRKSILRERERLREMTGPRHYAKPLPEMIESLNAHLRGWANYYSQGDACRVLTGLNAYVSLRLYCHLQRRSQRPWRPPRGSSVWRHMIERYGLIPL
jgi:RNA-directed DNA polymerase